MWRQKTRIIIHKWLHVDTNKFKIVIQDLSKVMWLIEIVWEFNKSLVHLNVWFINFVVRNRVGGCGLDMALCSQFRQWQLWTEKHLHNYTSTFLFLEDLMYVNYIHKQINYFTTLATLSKQNINDGNVSCLLWYSIRKSIRASNDLLKRCVMDVN